MYSYRDTIKSDKSDELINTFLLRPIAGMVVRVLYDTPVTANHVTIVSICSGVAAALFYGRGTAGAFVIAGLLVTVKDVLDSADGQLARARQHQSRTGRFLDSIGDFVVNAAVFGSIGWTLYQITNEWTVLLLAFIGLIGITLRVSYHVFYQVHYLHLQNQYMNNRLREEIREEDLHNGTYELTLQRIFQVIYGWQDNMMVRIDEWCAHDSARKFPEPDSRESLERSAAWYSDTFALRLSGLLGFGTELFLLMLCSIFNTLKIYLFLNMFLMNGILIICILYRRIFLSVRCFPGKRFRH